MSALNLFSGDDFELALATLFERAPRFCARLAAGRPYQSYEALLDQAALVAESMPDDEQLELINSHPRIGADPASISGLSYREQGYDRAEADPATTQATLDRLNAAYEQRFGFHFVVHVAGRPRAAIVPLIEAALHRGRNEEKQRALGDVNAIARERLALRDPDKAAQRGEGVRSEIYYGKSDVVTYRTYGTPLRGVRPIPESSFAGRDNVLMAADIEVQVLGTAFLAAYTQGDNRLVVATDTMKNFIHRESLAFTGSTLEAWLLFIGRRFLETYPHMERLRVRGVEIPFEPSVVPADVGEGFGASNVLFQRQHADRSSAELELTRAGDGTIELTDLRCGRQGLQLMKVSGSSFADFARDEYTTLPERRDRPLYIHLDVGWRYAQPDLAVAADYSAYVAGEQVADLVAGVFHRFVSLSIQHLVQEIGNVMLERFEQLAEVSFEAQNRLWDVAVTSDDDERVKVYCDPRPPYGRIGLVLRRD